MDFVKKLNLLFTQAANTTASTIRTAPRPGGCVCRRSEVAGGASGFSNVFSRIILSEVVLVLHNENSEISNVLRVCSRLIELSIHY